MKEFTVGDMIKALQKLDKDLPLYDHYYDQEEDGEVWFNLAKPKPKRVSIYLIPHIRGKEVLGEWTDEKPTGEILAEKKVVILYPLEKDEIEMG